MFDDMENGLKKMLPPQELNPIYEKYKIQNDNPIEENREVGVYLNKF